MAKVKRIGKGCAVKCLPDKYVVVDIETTGLDPQSNEIIEISALKYEQNVLIDSYHTLVHPNESISAFITGLTGITNEMVKNAPDISECIHDFYSFVKNEVIVGYNINFDLNFLYDNLKVCTNEILSNNYLDVLLLIRRVYPSLSSHRQTAVAEYLGINIQGAHRAEKDCMICQAILEDIQKK